MDPTYPLAPIANFLGFALGLVPLFTGVRNAANTAIYIYAAWISVICFNRGVNTVVWRNNVNNSAPVWCDITTHIDVCSLSAITGCSLAISRRLYKITSHRSNRFTTYSRRDVIFDCILCVGLPVICGVLYYIVQGLRFEIFEELGCNYYVYPSGVTILLVYTPPLLLCTACLSYYIPALIWTFVSHRRELNAFLTGNRTFTHSHYFRILTMEIVILVNMMAEVVVLAINFKEMAADHMDFWPGWEVIHTGWHPLGITTSQWKQYSLNHFTIHWNEWKTPIFAFIFFIVYGLSNQARDRYMRALSSVSRLSSFYRGSQLKEEPVPQVIHLTPGGTGISALTTKPSSSFQEEVEIKVERHIETHYDPSLFDIEKGSRRTHSREISEDEYSEI